MNRSRRSDLRLNGFTIVELLIVIVVIGILAAITMVSYNGIQNRANDTAIQSDLSNIAKQVQVFRTTEGTLPMGTADFTKIQPRVTTGAYGNGLIIGSGAECNLLYCWPSLVNPGKFSIVARSKSGKVYAYTAEGRLQQIESNFGATSQICIDSGITPDTGTSRDWFYHADNWASYVK